MQRSQTAYFELGDSEAAAPEKPVVLKRTFTSRKVMRGQSKLSIGMQLLAFFSFLYNLVAFVTSLRAKEEYFLSKRIVDFFGGERLSSVASRSDVWAWGEAALLPGLFGGSQSCSSLWSRVRVFRSADDRSEPTDLRLALASKGCVDDVFDKVADKEPTVAEYLRRLDQHDWTAGVLVRQVRAQVRESTNRHALRGSVGGRRRGGCAMVEGDQCYSDIGQKSWLESTRAFGFNWTSPSDPLTHPFDYRSAEQLGTVPFRSAHIASTRPIPAGGFVSAIVPFFSDVLLPEQRGEPSRVIDFRTHAASGFYRDFGLCVADGQPDARGGVHDCKSRFFCVRIAFTDQHVHQLCDPSDGQGHTTGVVRAAVEEWWSELRRARFLDEGTRALVVTLQIDCNQLQLSSHSTVLFEMTSAGSVLPSAQINIIPIDLESAVFHGLLMLTFFGCVQVRLWHTDSALRAQRVCPTAQHSHTAPPSASPSHLLPLSAV